MQEAGLEGSAKSATEPRRPDQKVLRRKCAMEAALRTVDETAHRHVG